MISALLPDDSCEPQTPPAGRHASPSCQRFFAGGILPTSPIQVKTNWTARECRFSPCPARFTQKAELRRWVLVQFQSLSAEKARIKKIYAPGKLTMSEHVLSKIEVVPMLPARFGVHRAHALPEGLIGAVIVAVGMAGDGSQVEGGLMIEFIPRGSTATHRLVEAFNELGMWTEWEPE